MTEVYKDSTSHSPFFELVDSTTGLPKTGIVYTDVTASYARTRGARTAITPATLASASASWSSGGFILVDDTNQPGVVRFDVPNAAFATGVEEVVVTVKATGCRTVSRAFTLIDINKQTAKIPATIAAGDIATDAITAASVKEDAVTKIQAGLASQTSVDDLPTNAELSTALAAADDAVLSAVSGVQSDTNDIQTRLPAALVGGKMDSVASVSLSQQNIDDIANGVAAAIDVPSSTAIAAALANIGTVELIGPSLSGAAHKIVRGSAYLFATSTAPYVLVAKATYDLTGATAQFKMKLDRQTAVTVTATIVSYDATYWKVYADLLATVTDDMTPGTGHDQFWVTLSGGSVICLSQCYLEVIAGIGIA